MQAGPRHHVGFRTQDFADAILDIDQLNQTETWVIGIEEEIDIAVRPGLPPGDRTKQVESRDPDLMKIRFVGAKLRDHVVSVHGWSPKPHHDGTIATPKLQGTEVAAGGISRCVGRDAGGTGSNKNLKPRKNTD